MKQIRSVGIVAKRHNREATELVSKVAGWLGARGVESFLLERDQDYTGRMAAQVDKADLILVFGGDGTMINAARQLCDKKIPLGGINLGKVGFLLELPASPDEAWQGPLTNALENGFELEERFMLECLVERSGQVLHREFCANETVVSRGGIARLMAVDLFVNGEKMVSLRSDGLIISTPTGSSAYNGSAGGPLLQPSLNAFCVTPICPFLSSMHPVVLDGSANLEIRVSELSSKIYFSADGQPVCKLLSGDILHIKGHPGGMVFAKLGGVGYFEKLQRTGLISDSYLEKNRG